MDYAPIARIVLRYAVGAIATAAQADLITQNQDVVTVTALAIGAIVEFLYVRAKRYGGST